jgi:single-strand DNA-binding protein
MNNTMMTIVGNVVDEPRLRITSRNKVAVANFRVASTPRRYDREQGRFVDEPTLYVNVSCWRSLAENVADSLRKGQQVIVTGRYNQREYEVNETKRIRYELEANAVGHDLTRGVSHFERMNRQAPTGQVTPDRDGRPEDDSDAYFDSVDRAQAAEYAREFVTGYERDAVDQVVPSLERELVTP